MKIRINKVKRIPDAPKWLLILILPYLAFFVLLALFFYTKEQTFCLTKNITGYPCPTCGTTRLVVGLLNFRLWYSFRMNPLMFITGLVLSGLGVLRLGFGLWPQIELTKGERVALYVLIVVLLAVNWAFLIWDGR